MRNDLLYSILVVDDDEDDRLIIDEAFNEIGYQTHVKKFINGKMLLNYLERIDTSLYPHLIVLDNTLPQLDAMDILSILKNTPFYKCICVVVYTTLLTPVRKEQLLAAGAYTCIEKGSTMQDLIQVATELKSLAEDHREAS